MTLKIGDEILDGKYIILDIIGEGQFGKVYRARDQYLDMDVAIKELKREELTGEVYADFLKRFRREARIGRELRHENIVHVSTLERVGDDNYLVMDYVDGPSLQKRLEEQGPLSLEEAVEVAIELCEGLAAVHDHPLGIVHRDIKPSNILLTSQGQPKITDFGLAQLHGESLRSLGKGTRHPGTPAYMSPEQERETGYLGPASDIYALGCVLFEMLTGRVYKRLEGSRPSEWQPDVPGWLDEVVTRMLEKEKETRYREAAHVKTELQAGLSSEANRKRKVDALLRRAEQAIADADWAEAIKLSQQGVALIPGNAVLQGLLTQAQEGQQEEAERSREQEERKKEARRRRAQQTYEEAVVALSRKEYRLALSKLREVAELDPEHGDPEEIRDKAELGLKEREGWRRSLTAITGVVASIGTVGVLGAIVALALACLGTFWVVLWRPSLTTPTPIPGTPAPAPGSESTETPTATETSTTVPSTRIPTATPSSTPAPTATSVPTSPPPTPVPASDDRIAFVSDRHGNWEIYVMNYDGTALTRLTENPAFDACPSWSPDGSRIMFQSERTGNWDIYTMNADGSGLVALTSSEHDEIWPAWSPDGGRLAFVSGRDGDWEIYVMNLDGTGLAQLTNNQKGDGSPSWSPDGTRVVFISNRDGNWEVYTMNADGTGQTRLTTNSQWDSSPSWSPDGTRIAFEHGPEERSDIYVMNADGTNQRNLTNHPAGDMGTSWSADSQRIAFESDRTGNWELYSIKADGTGLVQLTNTSGDELWPVWSP